MHDMQCMLVTSPTSLLIGGHHTKVIDLDLTTVTERQKVRFSKSKSTLYAFKVYLLWDMPLSLDFELMSALKILTLRNFTVSVRSLIK